MDLVCMELVVVLCDVAGVVVLTNGDVRRDSLAWSLLCTVFALFIARPAAGSVRIVTEALWGLLLSSLDLFTKVFRDSAGRCDRRRPSQVLVVVGNYVQYQALTLAYWMPQGLQLSLKEG